MKSKLNPVPWNFPFVKILNHNSSTFKIIKAFCAAFFISNSIYFSFFDNLFLEFISPFLAIYGLFLLLKSDKKGYFYTGFFIGLLWFYWIALSARFFNLNYLIPFEILGIGLFYGLCFRLIHLLRYDFLRLCGIFALSFLHPLGFDWLNWGILSVYGLFDTSYKAIIALFLIAYLLHEKYISRYYKIALVCLCFFIGLQYENKEYQSLKADVTLINTNIAQDQKYLAENIYTSSDDLLEKIEEAIKEQKELIILPETAFAFDLEESFYLERLQSLSNDISIIAGAFSVKGGKTYNSSYVFEKGKYQIFSKYYLVPFGEELPFFKDLIRRYILPNASEFSRGEKLNQYSLNNQIITNAICYEATKEALYKESKIIIATSNNAWFDNFVQAKLQKLLITFYASKYAVSVYHATNGKETAIITPKQLFIQKVLERFKN